MEAVFLLFSWHFCELTGLSLRASDTSKTSHNLRNVWKLLMWTSGCLVLLRTGHIIYVIIPGLFYCWKQQNVQIIWSGAEPRNTCDLPFFKKKTKINFDKLENKKLKKSHFKLCISPYFCIEISLYIICLYRHHRSIAR